MITYNSITFILLISVISAAIAAMHALAVFGGRRLGFIAPPISVVLHLLALALFLFTTDPEGKALELEPVVLFFILSLLFYTAIFFIADTVRRKKANESGVSEK